VPGLVRGTAPAIDLELLEEELRGFLQEALHGNFMQRRVPEGCRRICDVAISGNGEPTSCRVFDQVVEIIARVMRDARLSDSVRIVLITNGSCVHRPEVKRGLEAMAGANGEVWFKVDRATPAGIAQVNGIRLSPARLRRGLETAAGLCPTWIQTCMFARDGTPPDAREVDAWLDFLASLLRDQVPLAGVLLYGIARPSMQPEAAHLSPLDEQWMQSLSRRIKGIGLPVKLSL
jgi:wyosine [tRNA(Phe)-imidazoG37] synthetase (radical SAM superfamily)